ncbi:MAG TPA: DUF1080 domain-containing protein [Bryobacteraceae bacterium]|nr:DUF1080 domain-containing protein [Bryobacteraceae bacterium]
MFAIFAAGASGQSALEFNSKGWTDLLPTAPGMKGWKRVVAGRNTQLDPESQWKVDLASRVLVCEGNKGHEYLMYEAREYNDVILHAEWRFSKLEGAPAYNSGILVRVSGDGKTWIQAQTGPAGAWLFGDVPVSGNITRVNLRDKMTENRVKPAGEWNVYEITARGRTITLWANGAVVNEWNDVPVTKGHLALEAEGFRIEFRNLKVKELR